jgi:tetratricopeptide (TPR) repeat protein
MDEPYKPVGAIFDAAIELPPARRAAYLQEACAGNAALRQRVEALLRAHADAESFMEIPALEVRPETPILKLAEQPGDRIGRYKLLQQIGEGGCGVVYMAEQEEPVRRRVALKIIKLGLDVKSVIARFEAERQALALMDHPNIAKVLDAGATEAGRPYFVMELIKAIPITRYCDENHLSTAVRLGLFVQVCQALQHAHQKGIIHRDIKPSNILVGDHDGVPVPKVIDFGIAKATTDQRLTDKTVFTAFEQFIGTPAYMSPEQAKLSGLDIDTRSDIYSLGVLLYELLTGKTPFEAKRLREAGLDEIRRIIREEEPERPSTKLQTLGAAELTTVAKHRQSDPPKLVHLLCGDLDWIVMKALEKDRGRRYETANGLAMDIQRHLGNEPVLARPPSALYRMQKAWRRNRAAFAVAAVIAVVLLAATGISAWQAVRANREARRALHAESLAEQRLAESEAITKFLTEVFQSPDPARDGRTITVAEILGAAAKKLETDLTDQGSRRAKLQATVAKTYHALGLYREAVPLQEKVRDYHLATSGPEHPDTLDAMESLADSYDEAGRLGEALKLRDQVLPLRRKVLGPEHPDTVMAMSWLANSFEAAGRWREALTLREEVLPLRRKVSGSEHPDTLWAMTWLAHSYDEAGRLTEALKLREEVLSLSHKVIGPKHPDTLMAMSWLAISYDKTGRRDEALKLREEVLTLRREVSGPENPDTLWAMNSLAESYDKANRRDQALKLREEALPLFRKVLGPEHPDTVWAMASLAISCDEAGRRDEALKLREEVLERRRKLLGSESPDTLWAMSGLAQSYDKTDHRDQAVKLREEALPLFRKMFGPAHPDTLGAMNELAWILATSPSPNIRNGTNAVRLAEELVTTTSRTNAGFLDTLAAAYAETQQFDRAVAVEQVATSLLQSEQEKKDYDSRLKLYQAKKPCRVQTNP